MSGTQTATGGRFRGLLPLILAASAIGSPLGAGEAPGTAAWTQWGGPGRDFQAPAGELAGSWPEGGPEERWRRPLGDGYSAILFEAGRLYTMHRTGGAEAVICLDAETGGTIWERRDEPVPSEGLRGYGIGPRSIRPAVTAPATASASTSAGASSSSTAAPSDSCPGSPGAPKRS